MTQQQTQQQAQQQEPIKSIEDLRNATKELPVTTIPGFGNIAQFQTLQRMATLLSHSTSIPDAYRRIISVGRGEYKKEVENPAAVSNCAIATDMSVRMGISVINVMQNMHIIEGRPSWASKFVIGVINSSGLFRGGLRFALSEKGEDRTIEWQHKDWDTKKWVPVTTVLKARSCYCWAIDAETGDKIIGPEVDIDMAINEKWIQKSGSKWQTMPELMLQYRAASFFGNLHCPQLLMGIPMVDELMDTLNATITDDVMEVDIEEIKKAPVQVQPAATRGRRKTEPAAEPAADPGADKAPEPVDPEAQQADGGDKAEQGQQEGAGQPQADYLSTGQVATGLASANTLEELEIAEGGISSCNPADQGRLQDMAKARRGELSGAGGSAAVTAKDPQPKEPEKEVSGVRSRRGRGQENVLFTAE